MTDRVIDRVAELAGQTTRTLEQVARVLDETGLVAQSATLRSIAKLHTQIALDCLTETQPIELQRYNLPERIEKSIQVLDEIAADLLSRNKTGHSEISEAASLLRQALHQQEP